MSTQVRDYEKLAIDILDIVGKDNVVKVSRCATRLRLVLKQVPEETNKKVSELIGVIKVIEANGQFQVVIGTNVGKVYDKLASLVNITESTDDETSKAPILNRILATISAVFAPFIYILASAGILQGILIIITALNPTFAETGTYEVLSFISWAPFTFLPIFIAITASRHFKCNIYIAIACVAALVSPSWAEIAGRIADGESISLFGIALSQTTYTSTVLPPLFLVWILSYVEKGIEKILPEVIKSLFTPFFCMLIMVPLTLLLVGPVSDKFATYLANGYNYLYDVAPPVAAAIVGGLWQVIVIFGVHWGVTPMCLANYDLYGSDSFQALQTMAVIAQTGAAIGVFIKAKNRDNKSIALSAGITGIFGITEPAIYGVNLKFKKPFIAGCIAGGIGAVVASFFNARYYVYAGLPGLLTVFNSINPQDKNPLIGTLIGAAIALIGSIVLVQFIKLDED